MVGAKLALVHRPVPTGPDDEATVSVRLRLFLFLYLRGGTAPETWKGHGKAGDASRFSRVVKGGLVPQTKGSPHISRPGNLDYEDSCHVNWPSGAAE